MVHEYKSLKKKPPPTDGEILEALAIIKNGGKSIRQVALSSGIPKTTLTRYANRLKDCSNIPPDTQIKPSFNNLQVLSPKHEQELKDYLIESQLRSHGLSPTRLKKLVYSFAIFNSVPVPPSWVKTETAGKDWLTGFLKRNPRLSIRKPEATSQARAAGLNKVVMNRFYDQVMIIKIII